MRTATYIFVFCMISGPSLCQETFFNYVEGWVNNQSIELEDEYLLMGLNAEAGPFEHTYQYNYIDNNGVATSEYTYFIDSVFSTTSRNGSQITLRRDEDLYIASALALTSDSSIGTLFKFDLLSQQMELLHVYDSGYFEQLYCIEEKDASSLLLASYVAISSGFKQVRLYQTDLQGNIDWTFSSSCGNDCRSYPQQILSLSNGNIALLFRELDLSPGGLHEREQAVLVMLTGEGEELWRVYPGEEDTHRIVPGGMIERDGELLVAYSDPWVYDLDDGQWLLNYESTIYVDRYALDSSLLDTFSFSGLIPNGFDPVNPDGVHTVTQFQELSDENMLISGYTGEEGILIKFNLTEGLDWIRHFTPHPIESDGGQDTYIYHTLPTSDGGFLCTGQYFSNPSELYPQGIQTAIALKLDEYGCLEPGCQVVDEIPEHEQGSLQVWPNPASSDLNVRLPEGVQAEKMILLDALGRIQELRSGNHGTAHLQVSLSSLHLPSGLYTLILTSRDGKVFSEKLILE